jgi:hypothetical protein
LNAPDVVGMTIDDGRKKIFEVSKDFAFVIHECHSFKDKYLFPLSNARILKQDQIAHVVHLYVGFIEQADEAQ